MYKIGKQIRGIVGYADGYGVDESGNVYTFKQGRQRKLKQHSHKGYRRVFLFRNNKRKAHFVHRLVADSFIKNPDKKQQVNHKDGNKRNNEVQNLEWCTREENQKHSREVLGNTGRGTRNPNYGYRKSKFYPSPELRNRLIELGVPRNKHDIVSLGEMLRGKELGCFKEVYWTNEDMNTWSMTHSSSGLCMVSADTETDLNAKMLIHLLENKLISLTGGNAE